MSGVLLQNKRKHPEGVKLSDALREDEDLIKARKGLIGKTATLVKAADDDSDANAGLGETMRPDDDQLNEINKFTRKSVTADEVVTFTTLSCNDLVDRDDDQFTTQCVKDFAALEQPYSPVGKSFMLDHAYSTSNAVGRIYGVDTKKVSSALFLTNDVYMPKTPQFEPLIEKIDFGINWAVSVGVMLGKDECSVCKEPFSSWGWWCRNGHDKGLYYDPNSDETDNWGYPEPVDPGTKGAIKCIRQFSEPRDMYELSQVFLGAQYFAALEKEPEFASVMKSAVKGVPTIGLSKSEAEKLPIRHEPSKVSEARRSFKIKEAEDGSLVWTDAEGLRWTFDPENPDDGIMSLGKSATNEEEDEDGEHAIRSDEGGDGSGEPNVGVGESDSESGVGGSGSGSDSTSAAGDESGSEQGEGESGSSVDDEDSEDEEESDEDSEDENESDDETEEKSVSKKSVLAFAEKAKLPSKVIDAAKEHSGNGLEPLLRTAGTMIEDLQKEVTGLSEKAALGDAYLKQVRADAIDWYVKSHQTKEDPKVSTTTFERLLDKCGDDVELIKAMSDEQKDLAQAKFPTTVRRSSFPSDPNSAKQLGGFGNDDDEIKEGGDDNDKRVKRLHG